MIYYSLQNILTNLAHYYMIFGERSNGKTFAVLMRILEKWINKGEQGAYVRRYDEEIKGSKGDAVFSAISALAIVEKLTGGEWQSIQYYNRRWYLAKWDDDLNKWIKQGEPFCYAFALNQAEHYKSTSYPNVTTIFYDEFLTRKPYIVNEFVEFTNLISTIVRQRDNVEIFMCANTVNQYCPYFAEMGLYKVRDMEPGDIDVYEYGKTKLRVAVEYCDTNTQNPNGKKSDVYFAFDNPKLKMITTGAWELPMYPHAPVKINEKNILDVCFIKFAEDLIQGDIVLQDDMLFIFFHVKTSELKDDDRQIYTLEFSPKQNYAVCPIKGYKNKLAQKIGELFLNNLVFYQNNQVGEVVRNYILESSKRNSTNL